MSINSLNIILYGVNNMTKYFVEATNLSTMELAYREFTTRMEAYKEYRYLSKFTDSIVVFGMIKEGVRYDLMEKGL